MQADVQRRFGRPAATALATSLTAAVTVAPTAVGQGGEDAASATPIPALPYADTGTTLGFADDSDEVCPYTGSTSPDVYYAYTPSRDEFIDIYLCHSFYDTKTYVYDSTLALVLDQYGRPACNDDGCSSKAGHMFASHLDCVPVAAGETYYVVVDGWSGAAGTYDLEMTAQVQARCPGPCVVPCPPGATIEGEPCDFGNPAPVDDFNGGCNSTAEVFGSISCGESICGTGYFDGAFRDTDWFEVDTTADTLGTTFTLEAIAEFELVIGRTFCGSQGCACIPEFGEFDIAGACEPASFTTPELPPGIYTFVIAPNFTNIVDCNTEGFDYVTTLTCVPTVPPCPWDLDGDNVVGFTDLLKVLSFWGPCP